MYIFGEIIYLRSKKTEVIREALNKKILETQTSNEYTPLSNVGPFIRIAILVGLSISKSRLGSKYTLLRRILPDLTCKSIQQQYPKSNQNYSAQA